jgi:chemotaxis protein methyltransferase WspC
MNPIEQMLREKIGLDAASVGSSVIERTVRLRMKTLGLNQVEEYRRLLMTSRQEWEELVEAVVVIETWFFRDRDSFAALVELVRREWLPQHTAPQSVIRLLSVACASGEEPYSLAMALLDAEVPPERFAIDAVDISARALARAQRAVYGKNSFRGKHLDFRPRHFTATHDGYALHPSVRNCVQFHRANVFEEDFLAGRESSPTGRFDFIFCRNLLIYFDRATQARALDKLGRMLLPQACLFVGPAELPLATVNGFVSANVPMAFACRRAGEGVKTLPARPDRTSGISKTLAPAPGNGRLSNQFPPAVQAQATARAHAAPAERELITAHELADAGKLDEAAAICRAHLEREGPSAQAYYLLGLVGDAAGDPEAIACYRRALYLDPNHYETLLQMTLLLEKNGDGPGARAFKRRAANAKSRTARTNL